MEIQQKSGDLSLLASLHQLLPSSFRAHEVYGTEQSAALAGGEYLYVQGRGDRLHLFARASALADESARQRFAASNVNWRWILAAPGEGASIQTSAAALGAGIVELGARLEVLRPAPPKPGIFLRNYPEVAAVWKQMSSW